MLIYFHFIFKESTKSEIRNPKQIQMTKKQMSKTKTSARETRQKNEMVVGGSLLLF